MPLVVSNLTPFVKTVAGHIGIVLEDKVINGGHAWLKHMEAEIGGRGVIKWYSPEGENTYDRLEIMRRPTEQEVIDGMSLHVLLKALELKIVYHV